MTSEIDPTKPETGNAKTQNVRDNFSAAKKEIEDLQSRQNPKKDGNKSGQFVRLNLAGDAYELVGIAPDFQGSFDASREYLTGQIVQSEGSSYYSLINGNLGNFPSESPEAWNILALRGLRGLPGPAGPPGVYVGDGPVRFITDSNKTFSLGVSHEDIVVIADSIGTAVPDSDAPLRYASSGLYIPPQYDSYVFEISLTVDFLDVDILDSDDSVYFFLQWGKSRSDDYDTSGVWEDGIIITDDLKLDDSRIFFNRNFIAKGDNTYSLWYVKVSNSPKIHEFAYRVTNLFLTIKGPTKDPESVIGG